MGLFLLSISYVQFSISFLFSLTAHIIRHSVLYDDLESIAFLAWRMIGSQLYTAPMCARKNMFHKFLGIFDNIEFNINWKTID